jgi:hypothetical protein
VLTFAYLFLAVGLLLIITRSSTAGPLDRAEKIYVAAAPLPVILTLVLPSMVHPPQPHSPHDASLGAILSVIGTWLSVALTLTLLLLLWRRSRRHLPWDIRILAAGLVAAMPVLMVGLIALLYAL